MVRELRRFGLDLKASTFVDKYGLHSEVRVVESGSPR